MAEEWHAVTPRQQAMASLSWTISGRDAGAIAWLREQQTSVAHRYGGCYPDPSPIDMDAWAAAVAADPVWREAKASPLHRWRQTWQWWVVQRAVAAAALTELQKVCACPPSISRIPSGHAGLTCLRARRRAGACEPSRTIRMPARLSAGVSGTGSICAGAPEHRAEPWEQT